MQGRVVGGGSCMFGGGDGREKRAEPCGKLKKQKKVSLML